MITHMALKQASIFPAQRAAAVEGRGLRETVVRRLLHPDHASKTQKLAAALAVLGKRMTMRLDDAA